MAVAVAATLSTNVPVLVTLATVAPTGMPGPVTVMPTPRPTVLVTVTVVLALTSSVEVMVEVTVLNLIDSGHEMTLDCADRLLNLMGSGNVLTLTGTCQHLNVLGSNNQIWVQRALAIDVVGTANAVTWEGAFEDGSPPAVAVVGIDSSVTQGPMP